jgi:nitrogenase molybdenum-iron protein beta chain
VKALADEDAEVFGGRRIVSKCVRNLAQRYNPSLIGMVSTCSSTAAGEDLEDVVKQVGREFSGKIILLKISNDAGSHAKGYNIASRAVLQHVAKVRGKSDARLNLIPGMINPGDLSEIKRMLTASGVQFNVLFDFLSASNTPEKTGINPPSPGVTRLADLAGAADSAGTIALCRHAGGAAASYLHREFKVPAVQGPLPVGIGNTDMFLDNALRLSGKKTAVTSLTRERSQLQRAVANAVAHTAGKRVALTGDPDFVASMARFACELKMVPTVVMSNTVSELFTLDIGALAEFGVSPVVITGSDLNRFEALLQTIGTDVVFGPSYAAESARNTGLALIRLGFPIYDQPSCHRWPVLGYKGGLRLLDLIVGVLAENGRNTRAGPTTR